MSPTIAWLLSLSGYTLIAVICGLIALEELGVPMPFMPGDFLLFVTGASLATAHANPLLAVAAVYLAAVLGAMGGRELFLRIGSASLPRIAALLHAGDRVDRLTARLRRGGAGAVFLGRITPGMRINTTYASGLVALPRRTFLTGLVPGIAVYDLVFIGLGAWLGKAAWTKIEVYSHQPVILLLVLLTVVAIGLAAHVLVRYSRGRRQAFPTTARGRISVAS